MPDLEPGAPDSLPCCSPQVRDGDMVDIDVGKKAMTLEVEEAELKARRDAWTAPPLKATAGTLYKYCKLVSSASTGCVTDA